MGVEFAVFTGRHQSFRSQLLNVATGGQLSRDPHGRVLVRALESVNLSVKSGERIALLGPNGAGKSTLLRVLSRVYRPTSGVAKIGGSIGSLIDISLGINPEATGRENIFFRAAMLGIPNKIIKSRIDEVIEFAELGDFIEMPVRTYSSGMQVRLAFAVSTAFTPEILIMDEWLSVGDEKFRSKAEERLSRLVNGSEILVLASHSRQLAEKTCSRGIVLHGGRIVFDGPILEATHHHFDGAV